MNAQKKRRGRGEFIMNISWSLSHPCSFLKKKICCCSVTKSWPALCDPMHCSMPAFPEVCPSSCPPNGWCHPTISSFVAAILLLLPSVFPSIRVFSNVSVLHIRWPKYWSFSNSPSNEYSGFPLGLTGLISCSPRDSLKCLLQHHNSKASIL